MDKLLSTIDRRKRRRQTSRDATGVGSETVINLASAVFNSTREAIVVTDPKGVIIAVNPAFSAITGYAALDVIGKSMRKLQSGRQGRAFYKQMWDHVSRTGYWQGEIWNKRKSGEVYPALLTISSVKNRLGLPTHYVGTSTDLTHIRKSELKLDHFAHHDELTGLPNRRLLNMRIDQALARAIADDRAGAVVFVDLDRFKLVNDSLGHSGPEELLQHADAALYQAKSAGKSTFKLYSSDLTQRANARLALDSQLRRALARDEFVLHYQPLVTLAERRIFGVEALIRWQDPTRGSIAPADFLSVAEETGLIVPIGSWVLRTACAQMKAWRNQGLDLSPIAVNISARQFRHPDFAATVAHALRQANLPAKHLELEITEATVMGQDDTTLTTLRALKSLGVKLAVDDFGTGYSSLAYLKTLPVDKLKIDRTFVTDVASDSASAAITTAIVGLGRCLGLEVLAEGIQTEEQRIALLASGCTQGQGFLFAHPVTFDALPDLAGVRHLPHRRAHPGAAHQAQSPAQ